MSIGFLAYTPPPAQIPSGETNPATGFVSVDATSIFTGIVNPLNGSLSIAVDIMAFLILVIYIKKGLALIDPEQRRQREIDREYRQYKKERYIARRDAWYNSRRNR